MTFNWETRIGLEVHAQLTRCGRKLFSGGLTAFGREANTSVALFDAAVPGTLPVLNRNCVEQAVKTGVALGGRVSQCSRFVRKHYFYSDMPLGYQITQGAEAVVVGGELEGVRILRIQLEQDSGKSLHDLSPGSSYIDLNRAGTALLEIVTAPDMKSAEEACSFIRELQRILKCLGVSDGAMEEGSLRVDLNVSSHCDRGVGLGRFDGERVEIKNLNTLKGIVGAVGYEEIRQRQILLQGGEVLRETRAWQGTSRSTTRLRGKEELLDYKFMDDPDLPVLKVDPEFIEHVSGHLPELPHQIIQRMQKDHQLDKKQVLTLMDEPGALEFFKLVFDHASVAVGKKKISKACYNKLVNELFGRLKALSLSVEESPVSPISMGSLLISELSGKISSSASKTVIDALFEDPEMKVEDIIRNRRLAKESDENVLRGPCAQVVHAFPDEVGQYLAGRDQMFHFLVGQVLKQFKGKADPEIVKKLVLEEISKL